MTHRIAQKWTVLKPVTKGSGVIAGQMYTRGCAWIVDLLPS